MKVKVGVSVRHIHLCEKDLYSLFGENYHLTKLRDLSQLGQYAANETVTIKTEKCEFKNVRVLGPVRSYTQVEISKTDAHVLGLNPPVRQSGDLKNSESIIIEGPKNTINASNCVIIANRHIHINDADTEKYGLQNNEIVSIKVLGEKGGVLDNIVVKTDKSYTFELHLDTDDANAFLIKNNDEVEIIKGEKNEYR